MKYRQWQLVLEACRERWLLQTKIAPHLVRPIRFVVPCYATSRTPRWMLALGLVAYEFLRLGRNAVISALLSPRQLAEAEPALTRAMLVAASPISDCACLDFRLGDRHAEVGRRDGADLLNYVELCGVLVSGSRGALRAILRDALTGTSHPVASRTVINAAGPWADDVQARLGANDSE